MHIFGYVHFFLFDIIYSLEEEIDFVWKRRNFCGMVVCVLGIPVCIGVIASGGFKSISSMLNWVILGLILVLWYLGLYIKI